MSRLSTAVEVLTYMVTEGEVQEKKRQEALASIESLKAIVPNEVYNWYCDLRNWNPMYVLEIYRERPEQIPPSVRDWISRQKEIHYISLFDIARFGMRKEKVSRFVIKTAGNMCMTNDYYVIQKDVDSYQLTTDINKATKFTSVDLTQVPRGLRVGWETKEVYV